MKRARLVLAILGAIAISGAVLAHASHGTELQQVLATLHHDLVPPDATTEEALTPTAFWLGFTASASGDTLEVSVVVGYAPDDGAGQPDSVKWVAVRYWPDSAGTPAGGAVRFDRSVTFWSYPTLAPVRGDEWTYVACAVVKRQALYSRVACSFPVRVRRPLTGAGLFYNDEFVPPPGGDSGVRVL